MTRDNTIVTIGDINYLWGIFMLIASARKAGMNEPFIVGTDRFTDHADRALTQFGGVRLVRLDGTRRSLACLKPSVMLRAETEYVTWADSDAFFTGNVSSILVPDSPDEMQFRLRAPAEMKLAFKGFEFGEDGTRIPSAVLDVWRRDIAEVAGAAREKARYSAAGSSAFCSLSLSRHRRFLEVWDALQAKVLPDRNVGVVDKSLSHYHQLDESTLNACLNFLPEAPRVQDVFRMDKVQDRLFVHFTEHPKPWKGWTKRAFAYFDEYLSVLKWAASQGCTLPGDIPYCMQSRNKGTIGMMIPWVTFKARLSRRLRRLMK